MESKSIDLVTAGRAGIDFNTTEKNATFANVHTFTKSIGGSPANIVQGAARLGLKTGFVGKISADGMGEYILDSFREQGIDLSGIVVDRTGARNCLAITEIVSAEKSGVYEATSKDEFFHGTYLYRENTADLLLEADEVNEALIKDAKVVLVSGIAFSAQPSKDAMFQILEYAKKHQTKVAVDIDYRPYGWKSLEDASECYQKILSQSDIIIGNREEFDVVEYTTMPDNKDNEVSAKTLLKNGAEMVVVKDGAKGAITYTADGQVVPCGVIPTKAVKTFGSGDAFAAGFMYGILREQSILYSMQLGAACASLVLQDLSCSPAMPTLEKAETYRKNNEGVMTYDMG